MDAVVKRNEGLGASDSRNGLDFAIEKLHKVLVVAGEKLDEHGVGAGCEVTFHHFRNFLQLGHDIVVHGTAFKIDADEGAGAIAEELGTDIVARTGNNAEIYHALDALMNGGTRNATFCRYFLGRNACIVHYNAEYLFVKVIYFSHSSNIGKA